MGQMSRKRKAREGFGAARGVGVLILSRCVRGGIRLAPTEFLRSLICLLAWLVVGCSRDSAPPNPSPVPKLSPNAPQDQPFAVKGPGGAEAYRKAIAPYIAQGRRTYPEAKRRYLAGLPAGQFFFAVTNLRDHSGNIELVFISVTTIRGDRITGRIASDLVGVKGFKQGEPYTFPESELLDWLITHPDGTEEGNVVGKFLDQWLATRHKN